MFRCGLCGGDGISLTEGAEIHGEGGKIGCSRSIEHFRLFCAPEFERDGGVPAPNGLWIQLVGAPTPGSGGDGYSIMNYALIRRNRALAGAADSVLSSEGGGR